MQPNNQKSINETTIEAEFLEWAEEYVNTLEVKNVYAAASCYLKKDAPEYRTTKHTGQLVRAFLKMRDGRVFNKKIERELRELQEVLPSLNAYYK